MYKKSKLSVKYGNKKIQVDGVSFDSKKEHKRISQLRILEQSGIISDLQLKKKFVLQETFKDTTGKTHKAITYTPDCVYYRKTDQKLVAEDIKASVYLTKRMPAYQIKKKMFIKKYPDYQFEEFY